MKDRIAPRRRARSWRLGRGALAGVGFLVAGLGTWPVPLAAKDPLPRETPTTVAPSAPSAPSTHESESGAAATSTTVTVRSQPFAVVPGAPMSVTLGLPAAPNTGDVELTAAVWRVDSVEAIRATITGRQPPPGAAFDEIRLRADASPAPPVTVSVSIPTVEAPGAGTADDPSTLALPAGAVLAIRFAVQGVDGWTMTFVTTPVPASATTGADDTTAPRALSVGLLIGASTPTVIDGMGQVRWGSGTAPAPETTRTPATTGAPASTASISSPSITTADAARQTMQRFVDVVRATPPRAAVHLAAGALAALSADTPDLVQSVADALAGHTLLSEPRLALDPSAAAAAGLTATYLAWLREGEDAAARVLSRSPRRSVAVVDEPLTAAGASLRHDVGTELLILPAARADTIAGSDLFFGVSASGQVTLENEARLNVVRPDAHLARWLVADEAPTEHAAAIAATLAIVHRLAVSAANSATSPASSPPVTPLVLLATDDLGTPAIGVVRALTEMLATTPDVNLVDLDATAGTDAQPELKLRFDQRPAVDLVGRGDTIAAAVSSIEATASMLPAGDPRPAAWRTQIAVLASTAIDAASVTQRVDALGESLATIHRAVVTPSPYRVTLGGRNADVRLRLVNTGSTPVRIRLEFSSPGERVLFPSSSITDTLAAHEATELRIPVRARSGGRSVVVVNVLTPEGGVLVAEPVTVTLSVRDLRSTGYLLSGGALIVLVVWWARHFRRGRRQLPSLDDEPA